MIIQTILRKLIAHHCCDWMGDSLYLRCEYYARIGERLHLSNPITFNEKLQWLKIHNRDSRSTIMVDKHLVKQYVAEIIGDQYIIPTIGVWDSVESIDLNKLPNQFVLKCTHDSGGIIICQDKADLNWESAKKKLTDSLKRNYYKLHREWPYKNVSKKILAETLLHAENHGGSADLRDYKFFCFNGKVKCFKIDFDRFTDHHANYYDASGNLLPFGEADYAPVESRVLKLPDKLAEMEMLAEKLAQGWDFLRVDFYEVGDKIYFGELTFYPATGMGKFTSEEWNKKLGDWLTLDRTQQ